MSFTALVLGTSPSGAAYTTSGPTHRFSALPTSTSDCLTLIYEVAVADADQLQCTSSVIRKQASKNYREGRIQDKESQGGGAHRGSHRVGRCSLRRVSPGKFRWLFPRSEHCRQFSHASNLSSRVHFPTGRELEHGLGHHRFGLLDLNCQNIPRVRTADYHRWTHAARKPHTRMQVETQAAPRSSSSSSSSSSGPIRNAHRCRFPSLSPR